MGYSTSKKTVERALPLLKLLAALQENASLEIPTTTPRQLAYALRDAFKVAEDNPKTFPDFTKFRTKFKIKENHSSIVVSPRTAAINFGDPITHLGKSSVITVEEAVTFLEVVGAAIKHKAPKMIFPNASVEGVAKIELWCSKNNYQITNTEPLTLERCEKSTLPTTQDTTTLQPNHSDS